jgi:hypothetical protein
MQSVAPFNVEPDKVLSESVCPEPVEVRVTSGSSFMVRQAHHERIYETLH